MPILKKYSVHSGNHHLADSDNRKMLFDTEDDARAFMREHRAVFEIKENLVAEKMMIVPGYDAWGMFKNGSDVWTKLFGSTWTKCAAEKWSMDDFTCGHFVFWVDADIINATIEN